MPRVLMDTEPLRRSRDFRFIYGGQAVSLLGTQLTAVAVPFQVYAITHSSFDVGLVSLAQLFPLLLFSLLGGSIIDAVDRRRLLMVVEAVMACSSAGLAINAIEGPHLWALFVFPAITSGLSGIDTPNRNTMIPHLVPADQLQAATAMFQALIQFGAVAGLAGGGLLLAVAGTHLIYWLDAGSFLISIATAVAMAPQPPEVGGPRPGLRSVGEGFSFLRGRQAIQGAYLIDINAMVFGMPTALFPALVAKVFGGGAGILGLLYAAPGAGALIGALTTGWVSRIHRQGRAVILAVLVWGAAITAFGFVHSLPLAMVLLAVAGWADMLSALFRNTIIQFSVPNRLRGRLLGFQVAVVRGGPRVGDLEAGSVATLFSNQISVVSGGIACIVGALILAQRLPAFRNVTVDATVLATDEDQAVNEVLAVDPSRADESEQLTGD